jgi:hypothetical protein
VQRERQKALSAWRKKSNTPRRVANQNHLFRTKRTCCLPPLSFSAFLCQQSLRAGKERRALSYNDRVSIASNAVLPPSYARCACNSRRISTSIFQDLKLLRIITYEKGREKTWLLIAFRHYFATASNVGSFYFRLSTANYKPGHLSLTECALAKNRGGGGIEKLRLIL